MTEITDAEAAEVLWASSEEGKAAFRAAWQKLREMGLHQHVDMTQLGQVVYAAHLAAAAASLTDAVGPSPLDPPWRWFRSADDHVFYRCGSCGCVLDWRDHELHLRSHGITGSERLAELARAQEEHVGLRKPRLPDGRR